MPRPKSPVRLDWVDPAVCSLDYRLKIIGCLPFFMHLPTDAILHINNLFHDRDMSADQRIYFAGDDAENLYLVAIGKVRLVRVSISGREVLLHILHGGEYFGSLMGMSGESYTETAIAQTDGRILVISSKNFEQILSSYPDVMRKVLEVVNQRLAESQEIVKQLSTYTVEQRVAAALLRLAAKLGEPRGHSVLIQLHPTPK